MRHAVSFFAILFISTICWAQTDVPSDRPEQKKRALEFDFFSPVFGNTTIGYEHYLGQGIALEPKLGIIGLGTNIENQLGAFLKAGVKFNLQRTSDLSVDVQQYLLRGTYFKLEATGTVYRNTEPQLVEIDENNVVLEDVNQTDGGFVVQLILGQQWVIHDVLVIDGFVGLGYGFSSDRDNYNYGYYLFDLDFPIAGSLGLSVGVLLP